VLRSTRPVRSAVNCAIRVLLAASLGSSLAAAAQAASPAIGAECGTLGGQCFQLNAVSLEGMTAYKPGQITPLYEAYLMHEVGLAELTAIATAITDRYRADGYFLSRAVVPPQTPGGGVGRIRIYEGYIGEVTVEGAAGAAARRHLKGLEDLRPLRLAELDRRLTLANDVPGLRVKAHLEPVVDDPARHRLVATTVNSRVTTFASVDNRGSKRSGPWQAYVRTALNFAVFAGDQLALAVLTVPYRLRAFTYGELSYSLPVGEGRLRAAISGSQSEGDPDPNGRRSGGNNWATTISYLHPLLRNRRQNVWAQLSANLRHIEQDRDGSGGYRDEVFALRGRINATFTPSGESTNLSAQYSVGERDSGLALLSRANAAKDFSKLNLHASHYRDLGKHAGLFLTADGQWSRDQLLSSETFMVGGAPYGRGFNYGEIRGDQGIAGSAELRAGFKPDSLPGVSFLQGYGFLEAGKVWNHDPRYSDASLSSAGLGVRMRFGNRATLGVEAAKPLSGKPTNGDKSWRPSIYLSASF
jgi:hemolysin activation/secretion protein